jgi:hypothetical protein
MTSTTTPRTALPTVTHPCAACFATPAAYADCAPAAAAGNNPWD